MKKELSIRVPVFDHVPSRYGLEGEIGPVVDLSTAFRRSLSR